MDELFGKCNVFIAAIILSKAFLFYVMHNKSRTLIKKARVVFIYLLFKKNLLF